MQPSPGLASGWYAQPQHPLRTDDHGIGGPSGYSPDAPKTGRTRFSMGRLSLSKRNFRRSRRRCSRQDDTILVTYYNAPHRDRLRQQYENLPDKLRQEGIEPTLPWLYGFKLDSVSVSSRALILKSEIITPCNCRRGLRTQPTVSTRFQPWEPATQSDAP